MVKIFQDRDITDAYSLVKKKSAIYAEKIQLELHDHEPCFCRE